MLMDLLPNRFCEDSRRLNDSSVFEKDLVGQAILHILYLKHILHHSISGDLVFAGHSSVGFIKVVQIDDSAYIYHRFHPNAYLSKYLERGRLSFLGWIETNWRFHK
jgi:hypothetical protein